MRNAWCGISSDYPAPYCVPVTSRHLCYCGGGVSLSASLDLFISALTTHCVRVDAARGHSLTVKLIADDYVSVPAGFRREAAPFPSHVQTAAHPGLCARSG